MKRMRFWLLLSLMIGLLVVAGCSSGSETGKNETDDSETKATGESGGTLNVAYPTQPQTLDPHTTTAEATRDAARLVYESLVTINENYEVIPQLAESFEVSDDRKTVTFKLREGVTFHNDEEMTAEDVIASMEKLDKSKSGLGEHEWEEVDDYNITLHLESPSSLTMFTLADQGQFAAIMPKNIAEDAGELGVEEYIGTGPYKFVEWKQDQVIHFEKFEDYQSVDQPASGLGGKKEALIDEINWYFVPDASTRVNGLLSGEYDFAHMLNYDSIPQIDGSPGFVVDVWPYGNEILVFNKKEGLFSDVKARQAVNEMLDMEEIMRAAFTDEEFFDLDNGLFHPDQTDWYTDAGKELYNQQNEEEAKMLLDEIGYDGEEVVILTSRDYEHHYNAAVATQQQLEGIGINAKLDVYDWPTLLERRDNPDQYDIFYTGFPIVTTPHQYTFLDSKNEWAGWTDNEEIDKLLKEIDEQESQEDAKALYEELQQITWEDLPVINIGKNSRVSAYSEDLEGYTSQLGPIFWNTTINH